MKRTFVRIVIVILIPVFLLLLAKSKVGRLGLWFIFPDEVKTGQVEPRLPGLDAPSTVYLGVQGIPFIKARSSVDAMRTLGYLHGRDRRFQMEMMRMAAQGRLREMIGDPDDPTAGNIVKNLDLSSRMLGLTEDAKSFYEELSPTEKEYLVAYSEGVNTATRNEPKPLEFRLLKYDTPDWTPIDSASVMAMMSYGLAKNWRMELTRLEILVYQLRLGTRIRESKQIYPPVLRFGPHLIADAAERFGSLQIKPEEIAPELIEYLEEIYLNKPVPTTNYFQLSSVSQPKGQSQYDLLTVDNLWSGSNNWAVHGKFTASGGAVLAGDPHLKHGLPPLFYLVQMQCPEFTVAGGCLPGFPGVLLGTNTKVAWSPTSNWADNQDIFVEMPDKEEPEKYYWYQNRRRRFEEKVETFLIRDGNTFRKETVRARHTVHGVVLNDMLPDLPPDFPVVALKRGTYGGGHAMRGLLDLYGAKNVEDARDAIENFTAFQGHWVFGDAKGNIGYYGICGLPIRLRSYGSVPVPGWNGTYEWTGTYPAEKLPWVINPMQGFVATANAQTVNPYEFPVPMNVDGDVSYRYSRIQDVLHEVIPHTQVTVKDMMALQHDKVEYSWKSHAEVFKAALRPTLQDGRRRYRRAAEYLMEWDGASNPDSVGATLYHTMISFILDKTMRDEMPATTLNFLKEFFNGEPFLFNLIEDPKNPAWDDRSTAATRETREEVMRQAFELAVEGLRKKIGKDPEMWTWGKFSHLTLSHPFGKVAALSRVVNRGPFAVGGSSNSVFKNQGTRTNPLDYPVAFGPSVRIAVDLGKIEDSRFVVPGGQSGRPGSAHYDDLVPLYLGGEGVPMLFTEEAAKADARTTLEFRP